MVIDPPLRRSTIDGHVVIREASEEPHPTSPAAPHQEVVVPDCLIVGLPPLAQQVSRKARNLCFWLAIRSQRFVLVTTPNDDHPILWHVEPQQIVVRQKLPMVWRRIDSTHELGIIGDQIVDLADGYGS